MCHLVWKGICECRDCPLDLRDGSDLRGLIGKCLCQYFGFHARTDLAHVDVERQTGAVFTVRKSCARMLVCIQNRANSDIWPGLGGEKKKTPAFFFFRSLSFCLCISEQSSQQHSLFTLRLLFGLLLERGQTHSWKLSSTAANPLTHVEDVLFVVRYIIPSVLKQRHWRAGIVSWRAVTLHVVLSFFFNAATPCRTRRDWHVELINNSDIYSSELFGAAQAAFCHNHLHSIH